ncbi:MAG TPA: AMP-binding protein [Streptosporangiaceae bacterium]|nr:AMP-binding protein [Streptosporangiaceae bacterium]
MLPNVPAFLIAFCGALAAGAVVAPMDPLLEGCKAACYLGDSGARVVLAWHAAAGKAGTHFPAPPSRHQARTTQRIARVTARTQVQADRRKP